jgi:hypothetical protein
MSLNSAERAESRPEGQELRMKNEELLESPADNTDPSDQGRRLDQP